ncbi:MULTISPECIES: AAA family ATPase [spotted fever group]|uniref:Putative AAA-ATPase n=1 Tax=Rickettsia tamurae subsp. buchneri TaxID=1462938 RepID=A0A8E1C0H0_9RICK|nr:MULTISPECIES: AAA family ATPase [spotted fever group]EER22589.1 hypothetical protein REIS_1823 [Rickettsia endosymbiont of Ixodes scapularis]KDO03559.1 putative AAA-ATPase [Rickettsia tamurae subsp. buchneri]
MTVRVSSASSPLEEIRLPKMRVGTDDFKTLLLNSEVFVDKSLMIKEFLEDSGDVILITRPRRWGKSLNMNMLGKFFEIEVDDKGVPLPQENRVNHKLFVGGEVDLGFNENKELKPLKIANYLSVIARQGQFPVISINFKDVKGSSYQEIAEGIRINVKNSYDHHKYLENSSKISVEEKKDFQEYLTGKVEITHLKASLAFLSKLLFKHFNQKVYILIDEYDTPINSSYLKFGHKLEEFEQVLELFRGIFGSALKTNIYLEKGVITGILRVAKANLFSDLNNVTEYTLLDEDFSQFYGFTQREVDELLTIVPTTTNPKEIKDWYNGYTFGREIIYNPWSIMQCLAHKGKLDHYWLDSGGIGLVDKVLLSDAMQEDLQNLVAGKTIISSVAKQINFSDINTRSGLFSLLLFSGYLNPTAVEPAKNIYELSVPNKEIEYIYETRLLQWVSDKLQIDSSRYYSFVSLLPVGRVEEFKDKLQKLLLNSTSFYQTGESRAELFYSGFMLGLVHTLAGSYIIESEKESGSGRADVILLPKVGKNDNAIIIEYKTAKTVEDLESIAKAGLTQINNKQYDAKIREQSHVQKIIKIAMAFYGKEVALEYQIDTIP